MSLLGVNSSLRLGAVLPVRMSVSYVVRTGYGVGEIQVMATSIIAVDESRTH